MCSCKSLTSCLSVIADESWASAYGFRAATEQPFLKGISTTVLSLARS